MEEIGMGRANSVGCEKAILNPAISNPVRKITGSRIYSISEKKEYWKLKG